MRNLELKAALADLLRAERESAMSGYEARKEAEIEKLMELAVRSGFGPMRFEVDEESERQSLERIRQAAARQRTVFEHSRTNGQAARGWLRRLSTGSDARAGARWPVWVGGLGLAAGAALLVIYLLSQSGAPTGRQAPLAKAESQKLQPTPDAAKPDLRPDKAPQVNVKRVPAPPRSKEPGRTPAGEPWKQETYVAQRVEIGRFTAVMGEPTVRRIGTRDTNLALPGQPLVAGAEIETGDADKAEIRFNDGSVVRMSFNAIVDFDYFPAGTAAYESMPRPPRIRQLRGNVEYVVAPQRPDNLFAVVTPAATATALGTEFRVLVREPGATSESATTNKGASETLLQVKSGSVQFANEQGSRKVPASSESVARFGTAPSEPKKILYRLVRDPGTGENFALIGSPMSLRGAAAALVDVTGESGLSLEDVQPGWPDFDAPSAFASRVRGEAKAPKIEAPTRVQVVHVDPGWPAGRAGIREGDIVVEVNGKPIRLAVQANALLDARSGGRVSLTLERSGRRFAVAINLMDRATSVPVPKLSGQECARLEPASRLLLNGDADSAEKRLLQVLAKSPTAAAHCNLGVVYEYQDLMGLAIRHYSEAVRLAPDEPWFRERLIRALNGIANFDRALEEALKNVSLAPKSHGVWQSLFWTYYSTGDFVRAQSAAKKMVALPMQDRHHYYLMVAWSCGLLRQRDEQIAAITEVLHSHPACCVGMNQLADYERAKGDAGSAEKHLWRALSLQPNSTTTMRYLSDILFQTGRYREARVIAERGVLLGGADAGMHGRLSLSLTRTGDPAAGEAVARRTISLYPDIPSGYWELGIALYEAGRFIEAVSAFENAKVLAPMDPGVRSWLYDSFERLMRFSDMERVAREWIRLEPKASRPYERLASALIKMGSSSEEALGMALEAVRLAKVDADRTNASIVLGNVYVLRGEFELDRGAFEKAEPLYRKALRANPNFPRANIGLGIALQKLGRAEEAREQFLKAIETDPENAMAHVMLGNIFLDKGSQDEAEQLFRKAIALDPGEFSGYHQLGYMYLQQRQYDKAEPLLLKAVQLYPSLFPGFRNLGRLYSETKKWDQAETMYRKCIELQPKGPASYFDLARVYDELKEWDQAATMYRQCIELQPNHSAAHSWMAHDLAELKRMDEALTAAGKGLQLAKTQIELGNAHGAIGRVQLERGELGEAEAHLKKGLEYRPNVSSRWFYLGTVHESKGNRDAAIAAYRKSLEINPDEARAKEGLKRLGVPPPTGS